MLQKTFSCLTLAVGGAALTAAAGAPVSAVAIAGALLSGVAGGRLTALVDSGEERLVKAIFRRQAGIDENHHILLALRQAHLAALEAVVDGFDRSRAGDADTARQAQAERFSGEVRRFLKEARRGGPAASGGRAGAPAELERAVFSQLPEALDAALAARGAAPPDSARAESAEIRGMIEAAALAELLSETTTLEPELPPAFRSRFRGEDGWFDLFVRDGAARLKSNEAFRSIWTAEKLARIAHQTDRILGTVERTAEDVKALADAEELRHREAMEAEENRRLEALATKEEILAAIARDKGVDPQHLRPILARLGLTDPPLADIPRLLGEAVDTLLARAGTLTEIHNDGAAIDEAIRTARHKLAGADAEGAIAVLDRALEDDASYARALQAEAEASAHRAQMGKARARVFFEKAFIQRTGFDHAGAVASLEQGLQLDPDEFQQRIELGDEYQTIGRLSEALRAYDAARETAARTGNVRDLSVSLDYIGDVQVAQGDLNAALKSFQDCLAIAKRLAASDSGNSGWQRDLIVSCVKIAGVFPSQAQPMLTQALAVAIRLRDENRLNPVDAWMPDVLTARLAALGT